METGLTRITEKARMKADERFTALMHHLSSSLLEDCHRNPSEAPPQTDEPVV